MYSLATSKSLRACFLSLLLFVSPAHCQTLKLVLDWFINPDHAPLFVAEHQGFFKEQDLQVELISPADANDPAKLLAAGKTDLALGYEPDLIIQVEQGLELVSIGQLIAQPLNCLMILDQDKIQSLADLKGKKIGSSSSAILTPMLKIMLQKHGVQLSEIELINVHNNLVQPLLAGKIDAIHGVMRNIEAIQVQQAGYKPLLFLPEKNGIPTYSELIYLVPKKSLNQAQTRLALKGFLIAIQKATAYLQKHPEESWLAFAKQYPALNNEYNHRAWNTSLPYFTAEPQHFSKQEWRAFVDFMRQNNLIQSQRELGAYISEITL